MEPRVVVDRDGVIRHYLGDVLHREEGPAVVRPDGSWECRVEGRLHSVRGLPSVRRADGTLEWHRHGVLHNANGAAIQHPDGSCAHYRLGRLHREDDLPAVVRVTPEGIQYEWHLRGQAHRANDLPAVSNTSGLREYWWHGKQHRQGGPAVVTASGDEEYWWHGARHRLDGPAILRADGSEEYWVEGRRHREDGPAIIDRGTPGAPRQFWYLRGQIQLEGVHYMRVTQEQLDSGRVVPVATAPGVAAAFDEVRGRMTFPTAPMAPQP